MENAPQLSLSPVQSDPVLDQVPTSPKVRGTPHVGTPKSKAILLNTVDQAICWFRGAYPDLFADPELIRHELAYKRDAHSVFADRFGQGRGRSLLQNRQYTDIAEGLTRLYQATNIPSRFEIIAANDGLKDSHAAGRLLENLLEFVDRPVVGTFDGLVSAVGSLPAPADGSRVLTWPNVTILPFLADPARFMVLKPGVSKRMSKRMGIDLAYSTSPKWHTYEALHRMSRELLDKLTPLGARDYIDLQSFIWVTRELD